MLPSFARAPFGATIFGLTQQRHHKCRAVRISPGFAFPYFPMSFLFAPFALDFSSHTLCAHSICAKCICWCRGARPIHCTRMRRISGRRRADRERSQSLLSVLVRTAFTHSPVLAVSLHTELNRVMVAAFWLHFPHVFSVHRSGLDQVIPYTSKYACVCVRAYEMGTRR